MTVYNVYSDSYGVEMQQPYVSLFPSMYYTTTTPTTFTILYWSPLKEVQKYDILHLHNPWDSALSSQMRHLQWKCSVYLCIHKDSYTSRHIFSSQHEGKAISKSHFFGATPLNINKDAALFCSTASEQESIKTQSMSKGETCFATLLSCRERVKMWAMSMCGEYESCRI